MKILLVNKFFYMRGGAERYLFNLAALLERHGHETAFFSMKSDKNLESKWSRYFTENLDYDSIGNLSKRIEIFFKTLYSREAEKKMADLLDDFRPDVVHLHNFNHQLTPSILSPIRQKKIPAVMTLHDYKLVCPSYLMLNHGKVCELCRNGRFYKCFVTGCHKDSYGRSLAAAMESYLHHSVFRSYKGISSFICPSKFLLEKTREMGLGGNFIHIPHFIDSDRFKAAAMPSAGRLVYFGRLSAEKGIGTLIEAVRKLPVELLLIGDGPLRPKIESEIGRMGIKNVKLPGYLNGDELKKAVSGSIAAVLPSEWYENNPMSILEAFALGRPVLGSRIGGIPELVKDGQTGFLFEPRNAQDLRQKIEKVISDPAASDAMGKNGRRLVEEAYSAEGHYKRLMEAYL